MSALTSCRACKSAGFSSIFDYGSVPLANAFASSAASSRSLPRFPLKLVQCKACGLAQITETVEPGILFSEYAYMSSMSLGMQRHAEAMVETLATRYGLGPDSLAVEIASNDGYLLKHFVKRSIPVLGIEPARNIAAEAERQGVRTRVEFFGRECAAGLVNEGIRADVVIGNNVLAHVADLEGVLTGVQLLLKPHGVGVFEFPYLIDMVEHCEVDTVYHEHLCYFALAPMIPLLRRIGLEAVDVERVAIHGGSLRLTVARSGERKPSPAVQRMVEDEERWGTTRPERLLDMAKRFHDLKRGLLNEIGLYRKAGKRIAGYGAAAKGTVLIGLLGIDEHVVDFVADRSPLKQGKYVPGAGIPVVDPRSLVEHKPYVTILFAWNFAGEIVSQQREYLESGGSFLVPIPELRLITKDGERTIR